jgi:hypothetical protein
LTAGARWVLVGHEHADYRAKPSSLEAGPLRFISMESLIDLTTRGEFRAGLLIGAIAAALILLLGAALRRRPLPLWGVVASAAFWFAVQATIDNRTGLAVALIVLSIAGLLWDYSRPASLTVATLGAAVLAWESGLAETLWIRVGAVVAIVTIGTALLRFERIDGLGRFAVPLLAITALGIWATVPDTEEARGLLGILVLLTVVAQPWSLSSVGPSGAFAVAGVFVWVGAVGGFGRDGSIVGAWAAIGLLGLAWPELEAPLARLRPWTILLLQVAVVSIMSRIAGLRDSALEAAAISLPALVAIAWLLRVRSGAPTERGKPGHGA